MGFEAENRCGGPALPSARSVSSDHACVGFDIRAPGA
jgi:hypothetical protein